MDLFFSYTWDLKMVDTLKTLTTKIFGSHYFKRNCPNLHSEAYRKIKLLNEIDTENEITIYYLNRIFSGVPNIEAL